MNRLQKQLDDWSEKGLLTQAQAQAIKIYEENQPSASRFLFRYGLLGLGILAIGLGLVAIIASNWASIPVGVKLGAHGVVNLAVAAVLIQWWRVGDASLWRFEALMLVLAVLTVTLMAMMGQILQTQTPFDMAMLIWWALVTPMVVTFGRTRLSLIFWAGLSAYVLVQLQQRLDGVTFLPYLFCLLLPAGFVFLKNIPAWRAHKPGWADNGSDWSVIVTAVLMQIVFFTGLARMGVDFERALLGAFITGLVALLLRRVILKITIQPIDAFMYFQAVMAYLTFYMSGLPLFFVYWFVIALIGVYYDRRRLVMLAVAAMALRIVIVSMEIYGSLMLTGFLLMLSGLAVLFLVKTYPRWRATLASAMKGLPL